MHQAPTLPLPSLGHMPVRLGPPLPDLPAPGGVCKRLKRAVLQTVALVASRVRTPPPPSDLLALAVAQLAERCTVNAVCCGFESRRPTFHLTRGVSQVRTKARDSLSRTRGFESRTPCQTFKLTNGGPRMNAASARADDNDRSVSTDAAARSLERFVHVSEKAYEVLRPTPSVPQP
jgi:hypothetical protein